MIIKSIKLTTIETDVQGNRLSQPICKATLVQTGSNGTTGSNRFAGFGHTVNDAVGDLVYRNPQQFGIAEITMMGIVVSAKQKKAA